MSNIQKLRREKWKRATQDRDTGMALFWSRCPEIAKRETRVVTLTQPTDELPAGSYAFTEWYCVDPDCDCRRVMIQVWPADKPGTVLATINYGWEDEAFYTAWAHGDEQEARDVTKGCLAPLAPQSRLAAGLLKWFQNAVLADRAYCARLAEHYALFKQVTQRGAPP